jgi:hypothetical protein
MLMRMLVGGGICLVICLLPIAFPPLVFIPLILGAGMAGIGGIMFLVVAFQDDIVQGLLVWFVPFYNIFYLITHWEEEKGPFMIQVGGVLLIMGAMCGGSIGAAIWSQAGM